MQDPTTFKVALATDMLRSFSEEFTECYPLINEILPAGFTSILDTALTVFKTPDQTEKSYLEKCVTYLDDSIMVEDNSCTCTCFSPKADTELYSYDFYDFLVRLFSVIKKLLSDIMVTTSFVITDHVLDIRCNTIVINTKLDINVYATLPQRSYY